MTEALENLRFNVAIAHIYELSNQIQNNFSNYKKPIDISELYANKELLDTYCKLLAPMAPHLAEQCWKLLGNSELLSITSWPEYINEYVEDDNVLIIVQVNGKKRGEIHVPAGASQSDVEVLAMKVDNVKKAINNDIRKIIYVPKRILNIVL